MPYSQPSDPYLWRMTHIGNLADILATGIQSANSPIRYPNYTSIGHATLVASRGSSAITVGPCGTLNDYVPFYFNYKMPMLYEIYRGSVPSYTGSQDDIVYLVTKVSVIQELNLPFVFTDRHAYLSYKQVYTSLADLSRLSWDTILDPQWYQPYDPAKKEFRQAEFLVHNSVPIRAIRGIVVKDEDRLQQVRGLMNEQRAHITIVSGAKYYF